MSILRSLETDLRRIVAAPDATSVDKVGWWMRSERGGEGGKERWCGMTCAKLTVSHCPAPTYL
jgi:hypothetical protein